MTLLKSILVRKLFKIVNASFNFDLKFMNANTKPITASAFVSVFELGHTCLLLLETRTRERLGERLRKRLQKRLGKPLGKPLGEIGLAVGKPFRKSMRGSF